MQEEETCNIVAAYGYFGWLISQYVSFNNSRSYWHADVARNSPADIRNVLGSYERKDIAKEFLERSKDYQR